VNNGRRERHGLREDRGHARLHQAISDRLEVLSRVPV
jgi:hypothetical protein